MEVLRIKREHHGKIYPLYSDWARIYRLEGFRRDHRLLLLNLPQVIGVVTARGPHTTTDIPLMGFRCLEGEFIIESLDDCERLL